MRRWALLVVASLVWAGCRDVGPGLAPGTLTATLVSPNGAEGAAVILLAGSGIGDITAVGDTEVHRSDMPGETRLVLINQLGGDLTFEIELADPAHLPSVSVEEVAGPDDELRASLSGYRLEIVP